jgi:hypothetical protein
VSCKSILLVLSVAALAWAHGSGAHAANEIGAASGNVSVLASESVLLQESAAMTTSLAIPGPGELFVTLTDLQFPTSFNTLTYAVSATAGPPLASAAAGTMSSLDLTAPMTLYANVFATVGTGGAGLYNLTATFVSAVPLPGSLGLFAGAALLLGLRGRRRPAFSG